MRSAISTARMLEAQTLLIVSAGTSFGRPAPKAACRAALEHLTHDDVLNLVVRNACAVESRADGDPAEPGCLVVLEGAAELAKRRTDG
jgi:hypothetical protein